MFLFNTHCIVCLFFLLATHKHQVNLCLSKASGSFKFCLQALFEINVNFSHLFFYLIIFLDINGSLEPMWLFKKSLMYPKNIIKATLFQYRKILCVNKGE